MAATDLLLPLRDVHKRLLVEDPLGVECRSLASVVVELGALPLAPCIAAWCQRDIVASVACRAVGSYHPIVVTGLLVLEAQKAAGNVDVAQAAQHVSGRQGRLGATEKLAT